MRRSRVSSALLVSLTAAAFGAGIAVGCSAIPEHRAISEGAGGGASTISTNVGGHGGSAGESGATTGSDGFGGMGDTDGGPLDGAPDVPVNPCGTECGLVELCDADHLGLDDNCDGSVDEGCPCTAGQAHSCFKGDPSYRSAPGCFPGTERCSELGSWSPCTGGVHADEMCYANSAVGCHPLQAAPFAGVNLKDGTGTFSADAVAGSEKWTVTCPAGVDPCPAVDGTDPPDDFKPLQSGEYSVLYAKKVADGSTQTCPYPLFVGAPGLRVELEWEHDRGSVDLDLHLHKPNDTQPWAVFGSDVDCGWLNCTIDSAVTGFSPKWFSDTAVPPAPVSWYLDPVTANNTCFFAPRDAGSRWQSYGMGCHNPRLDLDNVECNPSVMDPQNAEFCAPENINVDYPPRGEWTRVGVHFFRGSPTGDVHPRIKIFCNGALSAELGPAGFYDPERPVSFSSGDSGDVFWLVADVAFSNSGECANTSCVVQPLYRDTTAKTPLLSNTSAVESTFSPPYPPAP